VRQPRIAGFLHMLVGYIRVSSAGGPQSVDLRRDALLLAGVDARRTQAGAFAGAPAYTGYELPRPGRGLLLTKPEAF